MAQEELYERVIGGNVEYRKAPAIIKTSKVARKQWAEQGWVKSAGKPVGVSEKAEKPKATKPEKPKDEQFETV